MAMAKLAANPNTTTMDGLRKLLFRENKVIASDSYTLFERSNSGIECETALNVDEIKKKIKMKDNEKIPFLVIGKSNINNTEIQQEDMIYPPYELIIPVKNETSYEITVHKEYLEKLLECFSEEVITITFFQTNYPILIESLNKEERGLIQPFHNN